MKTRLFLFITAWLLMAVTGFAQKTISIESLLKEMVDRSELARFPDPSFDCKQFSSYDRESISKDDPSWFANNDHTMFIRTEKNDGRREFVMMETTGPGAVVRFWMTFAGKNSQTGVLRIYVDDYSKPVIEGGVMEVLSGNIVAPAPFAAYVPDSVAVERRAHNLYFPIPYSQRCKITYECALLKDNDPGAKNNPGEAVYYNINYRTYNQPVKVVPYSAQEMKKNQSLIGKVQKQLANKDRGIDKMKLTQLSLNATLRPGESKSFAISGMKAIQQLSMEIRAANLNQALRSTVMEIAFDGEKTVCAPVGDFYGIGYMPLYASTWYTQVEKAGQMSTFWVMPFEKACTITLHNLGQQEVTVANASAGVSTWKWDNRSMHFGAAWQQFTHIHPGALDPAKDINFATLQGKGVYVGDGVALYNTAFNWWGEGDEKVFVDGEKFPSHFGTGTEDYYGYAWCRWEVFTGHPYIAQPQGAGNFTPDFSVNARYRGLDGIPFKQSLVFDMEFFPWPKRKINYAPIAYWYMTPGGQNHTAFNRESAKEKVAMNRTDIYSPVIELVVEGENMVMKKSSNGKLDYRHRPYELLSNHLQMFVGEMEKGGKAEFEFTCPFPGTYDFATIFSVAPEYGVFNVYFNGRQIISGLDLSYRTSDMKEVRFGQVNLLSGLNTFVVELTGYAKGQTKGSLGIDKLIFNLSEVEMRK